MVILLPLVGVVFHNIYTLYRFLDFFRFCNVFRSFHTVLGWVHVCCIFIKPFLISDSDISDFQGIYIGRIARSSLRQLSFLVCLVVLNVVAESLNAL